MSEANPAGVVEDARSLHRVAQPVRVREVEGSRLHPAAERVAPVGDAGEGRDAHALVEQASSDVSASVAERSGDDRPVRMFQRGELLMVLKRGCLDYRLPACSSAIPMAPGPV